MRINVQILKGIRRGVLYSLGLLLLVSKFAQAAPAPSHPVPSENLKEVLSKQKARVLAGEKNLTTLLADLAPLSEQGDPVAEFLLGIFLIESDADKALKLLKDSAQKGCAGSAGIVGMYLMESDKPAAQKWLVRAASSGNSFAQMVISTFYEKGDDGYSKSIEKAIAWAELSKWQSYTDTGPIDFHILELREKLRPKQINEVDKIFDSLKKQYGKQPYYICGQSYLPPGGLSTDYTSN